MDSLEHDRFLARWPIFKCELLFSGWPFDWSFESVYPAIYKYTVVYPFSHNHGKAENSLLNERKRWYWRYTHVPLNHDCGRKNNTEYHWFHHQFSCGFTQTDPCQATTCLVKRELKRWCFQAHLLKGYHTKRGPVRLGELWNEHNMANQEHGFCCGVSRQYTYWLRLRATTNNNNILT